MAPGKRLRPALVRLARVRRREGRGGGRHAARLLEGEADGVVAAEEGVVQRVSEVVEPLVAHIPREEDERVDELCRAKLTISCGLYPDPPSYSQFLDAHGIDESDVAEPSTRDWRLSTRR